MAERAKRPLNQAAVGAADDSLYGNHAGDPRPNVLFDAAGNRKPLDANDPGQADLRKEWMAAYKANGGEVESDTEGHTAAGDPVLPCERRPIVNPVIMAAPVGLDQSPDEIEPEEPEVEQEEAAPEDLAQEDESPVDEDEE